MGGTLSSEDDSGQVEGMVPSEEPRAEEERVRANECHDHEELLLGRETVWTCIKLLIFCFLHNV